MLEAFSAASNYLIRNIQIVVDWHVDKDNCVDGLPVLFKSVFQSVQDSSEIQDSSPMDISRDLATIHQLCATHLDDLKKLADTQFSHVSVTPKSCSHLSHPNQVVILTFKSYVTKQLRIIFFLNLVDVLNETLHSQCDKSFKSVNWTNIA